jgi:hypothetical protein
MIEFSNVQGIPLPAEEDIMATMERLDINKDKVL